MNAGYRETPVYFDAGNETLFGVFTEPDGDRRDLNVLTLCGGGWIPSPHRGAMYSRLAREYAADGYASLRFDYHGVGESTGSVIFDMNLPLVEDAGAALAVLQARAGHRSVIVGTCLGGRTAAALAVDSHPAGLALMAVPIFGARTTTDLVRKAGARGIVNLIKADHRRKYVQILKKRLIMFASRRRSANLAKTRRSFLDDLDLIVRQQIPCLLAFGAEDQEYATFLHAAQEGKLAKILARAGGLVEVVVVPGRLHSFASDEAQRNVIDVVRNWIVSL